MNVCVAHRHPAYFRIHAEILMFNEIVSGGGAFGWPLGREGGALINGMTALTKRASQGFQAAFVRGTVSEPGSEASPAATQSLQTC